MFYRLGTSPGKLGSEPHSCADPSSGRILAARHDAMLYFPHFPFLVVLRDGTSIRYLSNSKSKSQTPA